MKKFKCDSLNRQNGNVTLTFSYTPFFEGTNTVSPTVSITVVIPDGESSKEFEAGQMYSYSVIEAAILYASED